MCNKITGRSKTEHLTPGCIATILHCVNGNLITILHWRDFALFQWGLSHCSPKKKFYMESKGMFRKWHCKSHPKLSWLSLTNCVFNHVNNYRLGMINFKSFVGKDFL